MSLKCRGEDREIAVTVDAAELRLRDFETRCGPALDHLAVSPACDVSHRRASDGERGLNRVGRAQRTRQRRRQAEARHRERLLHSLPQRRSRVGMSVVELLGQRLQRGQRLVGILFGPRLVELCSDEALLGFGQVVEDVSSLVQPAALDQPEL